MTKSDLRRHEMMCVPVGGGSTERGRQGADGEPQSGGGGRGNGGASPGTLQTASGVTDAPEGVSRMQPLEYICFLSMRSALDDGLSVTGGALCDPALRFSAQSEWTHTERVSQQETAKWCNPRSFIGQNQPNEPDDDSGRALPGRRDDRVLPAATGPERGSDVRSANGIRADRRREMEEDASSA